MTSPFVGRWKLYGNENLCAMFEQLPLPSQFKCAMSQVRIGEEVHVTGDNVHLTVHVPTYAVPCHSKEINFQFGVEANQSLPFGKNGKVTVQKESETKWSAKVKSDKGDGTITREILNGEMWVTIECNGGVKTVRKFEKCPCPADKCPTSASGAKTSPFQGEWKLYGSDNFDKFMESVGVPQHWRCLFAQHQIHETIHVNGDNVHVRICVPTLIVPEHCHEIAMKFGEEREFKLPFGGSAKGTLQKISDTKWVNKATCPQGEFTITREIVGNDTWVIWDCHGQRIIRKFERCTSSCSPCGTAASCPK